MPSKERQKLRSESNNRLSYRRKNRNIRRINHSEHLLEPVFLADQRPPHISSSNNPIVLQPVLQAPYGFHANPTQSSWNNLPMHVGNESISHPSSEAHFLPSSFPIHTANRKIVILNDGVNEYGSPGYVVGGPQTYDDALGSARQTERSSVYERTVQSNFRDSVYLTGINDPRNTPIEVIQNSALPGDERKLRSVSPLWIVCGEPTEKYRGNSVAPRESRITLLHRQTNENLHTAVNISNINVPRKNSIEIIKNHIIQEISKDNTSSSVSRFLIVYDEPPEGVRGCTSPYHRTNDPVAQEPTCVAASSHRKSRNPERQGCSSGEATSNREKTNSSVRNLRKTKDQTDGLLVSHTYHHPRNCRPKKNSCTVLHRKSKKSKTRRDVRGGIKSNRDLRKSSLVECHECSTIKRQESRNQHYQDCLHCRKTLKRESTNSEPLECFNCHPESRQKPTYREQQECLHCRNVLTPEPIKLEPRESFHCNTGSHKESRGDRAASPHETKNADPRKIFRDSFVVESRNKDVREMFQGSGESHHESKHFVPQDICRLNTLSHSESRSSDPRERSKSSSFPHPESKDCERVRRLVGHTPSDRESKNYEEEESRFRSTTPNVGTISERQDTFGYRTVSQSNSRNTDQKINFCVNIIPRRQKNTEKQECRCRSASCRESNNTEPRKGSCGITSTHCEPRESPFLSNKSQDSEPQEIIQVSMASPLKAKNNEHHSDSHIPKGNVERTKPLKSKRHTLYYRAAIKASLPQRNASSYKTDPQKCSRRNSRSHKNSRPKKHKKDTSYESIRDLVSGCLFRSKLANSKSKSKSRKQSSETSLESIEDLVSRFLRCSSHAKRSENKSKNNVKERKVEEEKSHDIPPMGYISKDEITEINPNTIKSMSPTPGLIRTEDVINDLYKKINDIRSCLCPVEDNLKRERNTLHRSKRKSTIPQSPSWEEDNDSGKRNHTITVRGRSTHRTTHQPSRMASSRVGSLFAPKEDDYEIMKSKSVIRERGRSTHHKRDTLRTPRNDDNDTGMSHRGTQQPSRMTGSRIGSLFVPKEDDYEITEKKSVIREVGRSTHHKRDTLRTPRNDDNDTGMSHRGTQQPSRMTSSRVGSLFVPKEDDYEITEKKSVIREVGRSTHQKRDNFSSTRTDDRGTGMSHRGTQQPSRMTGSRVGSLFAPKEDDYEITEKKSVIREVGRSTHHKGDNFSSTRNDDRGTSMSHRRTQQPSRMTSSRVGSLFVPKEDDYEITESKRVTRKVGRSTQMRGDNPDNSDDFETRISHSSRIGTLFVPKEDDYEVKETKSILRQPSRMTGSRIGSLFVPKESLISDSDSLTSSSESVVGGKSTKVVDRGSNFPDTMRNVSTTTEYVNYQQQSCPHRCCSCTTGPPLQQEKSTVHTTMYYERGLSAPNLTRTVFTNTDLSKRSTKAY